MGEGSQRTEEEAQGRMRREAEKDEGKRGREGEEEKQREETVKWKTKLRSASSLSKQL